MRRALLALVAVAFLACVSSSPNPNDSRWYQWSHDAIDVEFAPLGAQAVKCAHEVAHNESNEWPFADNGSHHGIFQLHDGFWGSIVATANRLGRQPNWYDPRQNAGAAAIEVRAHGWHNDWPGTAPGWCP